MGTRCWTLLPAASDVSVVLAALLVNLKELCFVPDSGLSYESLQPVSSFSGN